MKQSFDFTAKLRFYKERPVLRQARFALLDYAVARQRPFCVEAAAEALTLVFGSDASDLVEELIDGNQISCNADGEIAYLYPVSCEETDHRVRLADGREFWAMCAIDSLGSAATFNMDAQVLSVTKDTGEAVHAWVSPSRLERIEPEGLLVSYYDGWAKDGAVF